MDLHGTLITIDLTFAAMAVTAIAVMVYRDHKRAAAKYRRWADTADSFHNLRLAQRKPR